MSQDMPKGTELAHSRRRIHSVVCRPRNPGWDDDYTHYTTRSLVAMATCMLAGPVAMETAVSDL